MEIQSDTDLETWNRPESPLTIKYSLSVLHSVDFWVGEGFLRIPYGGIEHGGLLFGKHEENVVQIEAFRPIECEHAAGPSFSLSENDIKHIQQQLADSQTEEALNGLEPVGLFISHSRRDLRVTDQEADLLNLLFPQSWQVLLLVKPEKFKPSQFSFALREGKQIVNRDLLSQAFQLPMPSRAERKPRRTAASEEVALIKPPKPEPFAEPKPVKERRERSRKKVIALQALSEAVSAADVKDVQAQIAETLPSIPVASAEAQPSKLPAVIPPLPRNLRLFLVLGAVVSAFCLFICFSWFYWNHLQAPVEMHAVITKTSVVVNWPANETNSAAQATLLISSGSRHPLRVLSATEKSTGEIAIPAAENDLVVELTAYHSLHQRRGVLHIVRTQSP